MSALFAIVLAAAAATAPEADPCAVPDACRAVGEVVVQSPNGRETRFPVNNTLPWVVQDNLLLVPGDWIVITLVESEQGLVPRLVRGGTDGSPPEPGESEIRFFVQPYQNGNLTVEVLSRRPETLDYAALMVTPQGPARTSVCSLSPGIPVYESWRLPIRQLAFWSFRPTEEPGCKTLEFPQQ